MRGSSRGPGRGRVAVEPQDDSAGQIFDFFEGIVENEPPAVEDEDLVDDALELVDEVRREEDRRPAVRQLPDDVAKEVPPRRNVEARSRIVKDQELGSGGQGGGEGQLEVLAPRKSPDLRGRIEREPPRSAAARPASLPGRIGR